MKYSATEIMGHSLNRFSPNYGCLGGLIGNYAALLTVGDHYDALCHGGPVSIVHRSSTKLRQYAPGPGVLALSVPQNLRALLECTGTIHVENVQKLVQDDGKALELIHKYEPELFAWALDNPCGMLYSDEFECGGAAFLDWCDFTHRFLLKPKLYELADSQLALRALTSIYLAKTVGVQFVGAYICESKVRTQAFSHYSTVEPRQTSAARLKPGN